MTHKERAELRRLRSAAIKAVKPILDAFDAAEREIAELRSIVADLTDPSPCRLDHHGNCQEHGWFGEGECPQARAKKPNSPQ